jgi:hypothetical protein
MIDTVGEQMLWPGQRRGWHRARIAWALTLSETSVEGRSTISNRPSVSTAA